jgi:hypothetical protein
MEIVNFANDIINRFRLPPHFNYTKSIKHRSQVLKYRILGVKPRLDYPKRVKDYHAGFQSILMTNKHFFDFEVFENHHETFVSQGVDYFIHSPYELFSKESQNHRTIVNHSIFVHLDPQKTIIDTVLEKYTPERFVFHISILEQLSQLS